MKLFTSVSPWKEQEFDLAIHEPGGGRGSSKGAVSGEAPYGRLGRPHQPGLFGTAWDNGVSRFPLSHEDEADVSGGVRKAGLRTKGI